MSYYTKMIGNSLRRERLVLGDLESIEYARQNFSCWGPEEEVEYSRIKRYPGIVKINHSIFSLNRVGMLARAFYILRPMPRIFSNSGAKAASRHKQEDDSGGEEDPDPDDAPSRRYADIQRIREATGVKFSRQEKDYWLDLLPGGKLR